ncbi:MAG TPA: helix-turn-helix domain-containing protein [Albitalea sp.]|uniref:helix-turn-helix domain-containing protein n=1 Tax=Piscinibacter sp. TaxID=1903157 RepID=UPI002ED5EC5B
MLMIALTCIRSGSHEEVLRMTMRGQFADAVQLGMARLARRPSLQAAPADAVLGQVVGRALIELGREEEAEELFRRQLRLYEMGSRPHLRWMSSLDHGCMQLSLNRLGRAAHAFNAVADDETAPVPLRIEALAGLALCVRGLGVYRRAERTLGYAQGLAARMPAAVGQLLGAMRLETLVMQELRAFDEGGDASAHAITSRSTGDGEPSLHHQLLQASQQLADIPVAHRRLRFLAALVDKTVSGTDLIARITESINEVRANKLAAHEKECRIEAALAQVSLSDGKAAQGLLGGLVHDEETIRRHRYSLELKYCLSRIYALQGRHMDALRIYKEHVAQALSRLHAELSQLPYSRCLEKQEMADSADSLKMQLPLRYRRAYQYIMEHLDDRDLSVREVATHVDVTERALQMAFRTHLGMTPAELIRRRRIERIRKELREAPERHSVLDVAQRWGMTNRSTLTQNYRQLFNETPTMMLRGGTGLPSGAVDPEDLQ